MPASTIDAEQVAHAHDADRDGGEQGQQHHVDEGFYGCLPRRLSALVPAARVRSSASCGLIAVRARRLGERMRRDRPHEKEQDQNEEELQRHEAEPGLHHEAEPGAGRRPACR